VPFQPTVRAAWFNDFENRIEQEDDEVWVLMPNPYSLRDDEEAGIYFVEEAEFVYGTDAPEASNTMYDLFLRMAAQRGNLRAMNLLALDRFEWGMFDESSRWAGRVIWELENSESRNAAQDAEADREFATEILRDCEQEGVTLNEYPLDVSPKFADMGLTYCLLCGRLKNKVAPKEQCDDSVHLDPRAFS